ncbi:hypothetical protein QQ045_031884 [Rhodiola kirilowii]
MSSSLAAVFFLLSCSLSLHACNNGRIRRGMDFDHHTQGLLDSKFLMVTTESNLQESEAASSSLKTISTITTEHSTSSWQTLRHGDGRSHKNTEKINSNVENRMLQEQDAAAHAHGYDSDDVAEDVVVMDYTQPRRKPPIHNEEH